MKKIFVFSSSTSNVSKLAFKLIVFFGVISVIVSFSSCIVFSHIQQQTDRVYDTRRFETTFNYSGFLKAPSLIEAKQTLVKEISDKGTTYTVYDVLILSGLSYQLSQQVFLLIDNDVFPIQLKGVEQENSRTVSQETKDITTADSTTISVVTGYTDSNRKITRFSYQLSDTIIEKIKHADQVIFQYYAGPEILTLKMKSLRLNRFKKLIASK
ncbi:MAG: hypothetical protein AB7E36_13330 [Salinivirgaceae bacterium]